MIHPLTSLLARAPLGVGAAAVALTLLLAVPMLAMPPAGVASQEPDGPAFDARDLLDTRLAPDVANEFVVVEAADGQLLDAADLRVLLARTEALRDDGRVGPLLLAGHAPDLGREVRGTVTIADLVDDALASAGGLATATDAEVTRAVEAIVDTVGPVALGLSDETVRTGDGWRSPAVSVALRLDNDALGGGAGGARVGADTEDREAHLREVRDVLRGGTAGEGVTLEDGHPLLVHGVAIDVNLTAAEQGQAAGPFIGLTVLLTLLLVGLVFRSAATVAVVGTGIAALMIWLQGWANLLGLQQDQVLATVVPIALISFGVDFAFHAIGRVDEERRAGRPPRGALSVGLGAVAGALLLALGSDTAAFLANTVSDIASIVQFGVAAAIGLAGAFLLLGVVAPTVLVGMHEALPPARPGRARALLRVAGAVAVAGLTTTSVLLTVYVAPAAGVATFVVLVVAAVVAPTWWGARTQVRTPVTSAPPRHVTTSGPDRLGTWFGAGLAWVARQGAVILPVVALVTAVAVVAALRVETRFDVEDFFAADTDFVRSLDALDRHVAGNGGERTHLVVTGALSDPDVVRRLGVEVDALRRLDGGVFATDQDGVTAVDGGVVDLLRHAVADPAVRAAVETDADVEVVDRDGDGLPDDADAVAAVLDHAVRDGLGDGGPYPPTRVPEVLDRGPVDDATVVSLQLPDSREVTTIAAAGELLAPRVEALRADLEAVDAAATATVTGAPIARQLSLDAISASLLRSLPIAVLLCLLVAAAALRSLRTAVVAVVPILLVVPWLYGTMWATGFAVNLVTGTIGAISIGIGIDFAIHLVARYRQEHARLGDRDAAMHATGAGTGVAVTASALSSAIGFTVLAFAPMPMFASFGLLTAVMIAMALTATLLVLPPLLRLTSRDEPPVVAGSPAGGQRDAEAGSRLAHGQA
jgi:uncharacterized protein